MEKIKTFFCGRLSFVILLSFFCVAGLYAQTTGEAGESNSEKQKSASEIPIMQDQFDAEISSIKESGKHLWDSLEKTNVRLDDISKKNSQSQIWQILLSVSAALISVTLMAFFVLLLLKILKFHTVVANVTESEFDDKSQREPLAIEKSRSASDEFNNKFYDIQYQLKEIAGKLDAQLKDAERLDRSFTSLQSNMTDFKRDFGNLAGEFYSHKTDMEKNREKLDRKEQMERDPVAAFNQWSQSPHQPFPQYFTYVANVKPEFREKQEFADTSAETDWIRNTVGEKKFLFPNPNKIDSLSGPVDKLYKVAGTRKGRGANSVKVTNACQIKEGNYIEYQGELTLM